MGIYDNWVYTDLHQLNLDWILKVVKEWGEEVKLLDKKFDNLNAAFNDLKDYVENYLSALDIEADVIAAVNAYLDDNLTDPVISNVLKNALLLVGGNVNPQRLLRLVMPTTTNTASPDNTLKTWAQGFTLTPNGYLLAFCNTDKVNNDADFYEVTSGHTLHRSFTLPVGHANALAYYHDKLFIAPLYYNSGGSEQRSYDLLVYDYVNLTLDDTITCLTYPHSVSIENDIIYYTNNRTDDIDLYKYDGFNHSLIGSYARPVNGTYQNAEVSDGKVYFVYSNPSLIYEYDIVTGQLIAVFTLPSVTSEGYTIGELEQIQIDGTDIYAFSESSLPSSVAAYRLGNLFKFNTNTGNEIAETLSNQPNVARLIYAEKSQDNNYGNLNPTGSSTNPFPTSDEALLFAMANNITAVRFRGDFSNSVLYIRQPMSVYGYSVASTIFESLNIGNAGRVIVNNMTFNGVVGRSYANTIERSDLLLNYCTITTAQTIPMIYVNYGALELQHCTLTTDSDKHIYMVRSQLLPGSTVHVKCSTLSYHDIIGQFEYTVSGTDPAFTVSDSLKFNLANNSVAHMILSFRRPSSSLVNNKYESVEMFLTSPVKTSILGAGYTFDVGDSTFLFDGETFTRTAGTLVLHRVFAF